jgi:pimeloyl-ACP methyl ester carboxylesterase
MKNPRKYGKPPFHIAVVHGGPGAGGEMAPVARELASCRGILEPIQRATQLDAQILELKGILENEGNLPAILIGHSWGAWLIFMTAAYYPELAAKLVLVGSGPFEDSYAQRIKETRLQRLSENERKEVEALTEALNESTTADKDALFARFGELFSRVDTRHPVSQESEGIDCRFDTFRNVWNRAAEMRRSGELKRLGCHIKCPVVAIHGDYDPHPAEGVRKPLTEVLEDFRFILLKKCGHTPWREQEARDDFFRILKREIVDLP